MEIKKTQKYIRGEKIKTKERRTQKTERKKEIIAHKIFQKETEKEK